MNYPKLNKAERNNAHLAMLQENGWVPVPEPYTEERILKNKKFLIVYEGRNTEKKYWSL